MEQIKKQSKLALEPRPFALPDQCSILQVIFGFILSLRVFFILTAMVIYALSLTRKVMKIKINHLFICYTCTAYGLETC